MLNLFCGLSAGKDLQISKWEGCKEFTIVCELGWYKRSKRPLMTFPLHICMLRPWLCAWHTILWYWIFLYSYPCTAKFWNIHKHDLKYMQNLPSVDREHLCSLFFTCMSVHSSYVLDKKKCQPALDFGWRDQGKVHYSQIFLSSCV